MKPRFVALWLLVLGALALPPGCGSSSGPLPETFNCQPNGHPCSFGMDCCSNACIGGQCATPVGNCIEDDLGCTSDTDCCSGVCVPTTHLCGFPPPSQIVTCAVDNQPCKTNEDCCSFLCAPDGFCGPPDSACNLDNDPCEIAADCCSNFCGFDGYCGL
jgi:hypothetical protein